MPHLFDFGHVSDELVVVDKLQDFLELMKIGEEVVSNRLQEQQRNEHFVSVSVLLFIPECTS